MPRRAQAPEKRHSAAQRCNDDVLEEIFLLLPQPALASAARVCRGWLPCARRNLYRTLNFDAISPSARHLANMLSTNSFLRDLIRRPSVRYSKGRGREISMLDWLALLPEHSLQSITFKGRILTSPDSGRVLHLPAVRTTTRITSRSPTIPLTNEVLLNMSQLVCLSITLPGHVPPPNNISLPNLTRLSIVVGNYSPTVDVLLKGLSKPLTRFDIKAAIVLEEKDVSALQDSLSRHAPHIEHLSFEGEPYFTRQPFLDDYITVFTSLRTLFCSHPSYTPRLLSKLPSTHTSLSLRAPSFEPFADAAFAEALEQHHHRLSSLRQVRVVNDRFFRHECDALRRVCRSRGIDFVKAEHKEDYYFFS